MEKREQAILGRIFESFTQFESIEGVKQQLLQSICELADASAGRLFCCPPDEKQPSVSRAPRDIFERFDAQFEKHFWNDPLYTRLTAQPDSLISVTDQAGAMEWFESPLFQNLMSPLGLHDAAMLLLRDAANTVHWCVWLGHPRRNGFTRRRLRVVESIAPQLSMGLNNITAWHERWKRAQAIESMLNFTDDLLVCVSLGEPARIVAATRAAQEALGMSVGYPQSQQSLEFVDLALRTHPASLQPPSWRAADGRGYRLLAMPSQDRGEGNLRLVRLEPSGAPAPVKDDLHAARVAGLSAREAAVFARMSRGLGNREIAEDMGISIDTVRAHLRNIFAKLEVCSRVEAVNAVRNRGRVFAQKLDTSIDTTSADTNVCNDAVTETVPTPDDVQTPETTPHGIGISAQVT